MWSGPGAFSGEGPGGGGDGGCSQNFYRNVNSELDIICFHLPLELSFSLPRKVLKALIHLPHQ